MKSPLKMKDSYPHIMPDLTQWPIYKLSEDRHNFVGEVENETVHRLHEKYGDGLFDLLEKSIYLEKIRIKDTPWRVDPPNEALFYKKLQNKLNKNENDYSHEELQQVQSNVLHTLVKRYVEEIVGTFKISTFGFARRFLTFLFSRLLGNRIFAGLSLNSSEKLREKLKLYGEVDTLRALFEKDMQIEQIKKQLEEATRKADQGSMQMQGEVQEIVLERELVALFPYDEILEVPKGVKGADCIQKVFDHSGHNVGSIIYESKRTKDFSNDWVEKLKHDRLHAQADIGIIITKTMPKGAKDIIQIDGIWICTFHVYKGLVLALRDSILRVGEAMHSQSNRGEKMHMLYDYLCSTEFKHQLEAVMEGFISMKESILREQMQMQKNWKEREKQIEKVLLNMSSFYGSVKGIAGSAIPTVKLLEGEE